MKQKISAYLRGAKGVLMTILIFTFIAVLSVSVLSSVGNSITQEQADMLRDSLYSAAVSCYAVTGRYPTLDEIQSDYGVTIDPEHYDVHYSSFASNVIPDIQVRLIEEAER